MRDPRFTHNSFVDKYGVRFYAAVPLRYKKSAVLGALCILDREPREMSDDDLEVLQGMAEYLMKSLEDNHGVPPAPKMTSERLDQALHTVEEQRNDKHDPDLHTP